MARPVCIPTSSTPRRSGRALGGYVMRQRILTSVLIALCAAAAIVKTPVRKKDYAKPLLSVSFQNYSNSPTGKCFAFLSITNRDSCDVRFDSSGWLQFTGTSTEAD